MDSQEPPFVSQHDMDGFCSVLKGKDTSQEDVICRKGTTEDVLLSDSKDSQKMDNPVHSTIADYTEEHFQRDFMDEPDEDDVFDSDTRQQLTDFQIVDRQEKKVEELADAICASQVFTGGPKKFLVIRLVMPQEDPKTVDVDVQQDKMIVYSHRYKMRCHFQKHVVVGSAKTSFLKEKHLLEVVIRST